MKTVWIMLCWVSMIVFFQVVLAEQCQAAKAKTPIPEWILLDKTAAAYMVSMALPKNLQPIP